MELLTGGVFAQVKFARACSEYYSQRSRRRVDGIRKYAFEKRIVRFFFIFFAFFFCFFFQRTIQILIER